MTGFGASESRLLISLLDHDQVYEDKDLVIIAGRARQRRCFKPRSCNGLGRREGWFWLSGGQLKIVMFVLGFVCELGPSLLQVDLVNLVRVIEREVHRLGTSSTCVL